jgi:predicted O-methyltransferase YrrM
MGEFEDKIYRETEPEYDVIDSSVSKIFGWMTRRQGIQLYHLAAYGPGEGFIVEIGSMMGKSTSVLAYASKSKNREKVVAIDHFAGSIEHQVGQGFEVDDVAKFGTTYHSFKRNMESMGVNDWVIPVVSSSEEVVNIWSRPIRLLYIDASHDYDNVKKDFLRWSPFVCSGGIVVFDDARVETDGPYILCHEIANDPNSEFKKYFHSEAHFAFKRM